MTSAGLSNLISNYGSLSGYGESSAYFGEVHQNRVGYSLWQRPDLYIKNSPVFNADKVVTPLLMMHNKEDAAVPFTEGVAFFTALRRLGKRVWMLQYDEGGHTVYLKKDAIQHTIRITQFFDHYLKGAPAPSWMLNGIPAKMKGIDDGLKLIEQKDTNGDWVTPQVGGLLTEEERKKVDAFKHRKPITVTFE